MSVGGVNHAVGGLAHNVEVQLAGRRAACRECRRVNSVGGWDRPQHRVVVRAAAGGEPRHHRHTSVDRRRGRRRLPQRARRLERDGIGTGPQAGHCPHLATPDISLPAESGLGSIVGECSRGPGARGCSAEGEQSESQSGRRCHRERAFLDGPSTADPTAGEFARRPPGPA